MSGFSDNSKVVAIPGFGRFPVSDRGIVGPYEAVQIWANERFTRIHNHVRSPVMKGWGLHSEQFVFSNLLPAIQALGYTVVQDGKWCFFRARPDFSVWTNDCAVKAKPTIKLNIGPDPGQRVADIVGRPCVTDEEMYQMTIQVTRCPLRNESF